MTFPPCMKCHANAWGYLGSVPQISGPGVTPIYHDSIIDKYRCRGCGQTMTLATYLRARPYGP